MRANKYSELPRKSVKRLLSADPPLILQFKQPDGRLQKIDLTFFIEGKFQRPQLAKACAMVFWIWMQNYSSQTRRGFKIGLNIFNKFLDWRAEVSDDQQISTTFEINHTVFIEFMAYLEIVNQDNKESTAASRYHCVTRFFIIMQSITEYLPSNLNIPPNRFGYGHKQQESVGDILNFKDVHLIAETAKKKVNEIKQNHRHALKLIEAAASNDAQARMKHKPKGFWDDMGNALYYLVRVNGLTSIPSSAWFSLRSREHPTPAKLIGWYAPTSDEYFVPFLVLLYLQTAINVTSISSLKRDCLRDHPLPLGLTTLNFKKPRAGTEQDKELCFPTNSPDGTIDLIKFLLEYTEPWVEYVSEAEKNSLFLYYSRITGVRSAGNGFALPSLSRFISSNNLPHFTFDQLRPTVATMLYLQTRDIFRVQRALNHKSIRTTVAYIKGAVVRAQHDKEMSEGIDAMVEAVTGIKYRKGEISVFTEPASAVIAAKVEANELTPEAGEEVLSGRCKTLTGMCIDPRNSPQPGEIKGRVCRSLHACIFCENCWIFAEDIVETVRYRNSLEAEKANMTSEMWEALHGEAVREINESILPSFPDEIVAQAELEAKQMQDSIMTSQMGGD